MEELAGSVKPTESPIAALSPAPPSSNHDSIVCLESRGGGGGGDEYRGSST
jgi:hypothetical protein